ncbi:universal stress protein [Microbacterium cremeum]|uniref:universal stress protein n=1 Tax=Microbacterium cremeum TaxID=2782169 RepID=UPI0018890C4C|nr:universal stress protein [Microbacterium cremeum]
MEKVVVGYDGSPAAESALDWVTDRALRAAMRVEVMLVANTFLSDQADADHRLEQAKARLTTRVPGLPVETTRVDGVMPGSLVQVAAGADLLVVGVDRGHPVRAALHGWLPQRVSAEAATPTCVVPRGWVAVDGAVTVGLADDGSSEAAVDFAAAEADAASRPLHLLHAWFGPLSTDAAPDPQPMSMRRLHTEHQRFAADAADRVRGVRPGVEVHVVLTQANPSTALAAASRLSSLLVIGTHRRGILAGGLVGSVGLDLIGVISAPLCVVPLRG